MFIIIRKTYSIFRLSKLLIITGKPPFPLCHRHRDFNIICKSKILSRRFSKPHIYLYSCRHRHVQISGTTIRTQSAGNSSHITLTQNTSSLHNHSSAAHRQNLLQPVLCHNYSGSKFPVDPDKAVNEFICRYGIKLTCGLIKYQNIRGHRHDRGQIDELFLST